MRKLYQLVWIVLMLALVLPVAAQTDTPDDSDAGAAAETTTAQLVTIAQIVEEAAGVTGTAQEFTVLQAAIRAADPIFAEVLSNPDLDLTVFAPTDDAFEELITALNTTTENFLNDRLLVNDLLSYHVVPGALSSQSLAVMDGAILGTVLRNQALRVSVDGGDVMINASQVVTADLFASNGIVHIIDTVLATAPELEITPSGTIAELVIANAEDATPEFTILLEAIQSADPAILQAVTGGLPYTVFAPTDAAFEAAITDLGSTRAQLLADTDLLTNILLYHIVPGQLTQEDLLSIYLGSESTPRLSTLLPSITLELLPALGGVQVNDSTVIFPDVLATNGVIHVIDTVLIPPL